MIQLQAQAIADQYSLAEIEAEIAEIKTAISAARGASQDRFDDTQAQISVKRQKLSDLREELAIYVNAKNILAGTDSSTAQLTAADYNPVIPRI